MCVNVKTLGDCSAGDECTDSHNEAEQHFHPAIYKTVQCNRKPCHIYFCYFAHGPSQLRKPLEKHFEVRKERTVNLSDFIAAQTAPPVEICIAKQEPIKIIRDWTGWQQIITTTELLPCPIDDVFSRMLFKYEELQHTVRDLCFKDGCTPYIEVGQRPSYSPVLLMIGGASRDVICQASMSVQEFLSTAHPKTEEKFPARFLSYLESDQKGIKTLKTLCLNNKGIDISVERGLNTVTVWGNHLNKRQMVILELKKICTGFALEDASNIADARLRSLEIELQNTQKQLQDALEENYQLRNSLKSAHLIAEKLQDEGKQIMILQKQKELPKYWESTEDYQEFNVEKGSEEWENVLTTFLATIRIAFRFNVVSIKRIENHELWDHFVLLQKKISNMKELWHGTSQESLAKICEKGFDRSYAGMHAVAFGQGTYFARDSHYSVKYASRDQNENRYMILAKVLVGRYMQGYHELKHLEEGFDTAVNRLYDPSIYVTFKDFQAYPAYVVKFRRD
ncbi:uncharacterized protein [Clytia hemisphaerica]|uniref:uncharacterized protein n=1 Tax=Clytia hemisphaerica TaxID=252671 RepID=UPI0034D47C16